MSLLLLPFLVLLLCAMTVRGSLPEFTDPIHGLLVVSRLKPPFLTLKAHPDTAYYVPSQQQLAQIRQAVVSRTSHNSHSHGGSSRAVASALIFSDSGAGNSKSHSDSNEMSQEEFDEGMKMLELYTQQVGKIIVKMFKGALNSNPVNQPSLSLENIKDKKYFKATIVDVSKLSEWIEGERSILEQHFNFTINKIINELQECGDNVSSQISDKDFQYDMIDGGVLTYYKLGCNRIDSNVIIFFAITYDSFTLNMEDSDSDSEGSLYICRPIQQEQRNRERNRSRLLEYLRLSMRSMTVRTRQLTTTEQTELISYFIDNLVQRIKIEHHYMINTITDDQKVSPNRQHENLKTLGFSDENILRRENYEYLYVRRKTTWQQAEERCQMWHGHLVSIHDEEENDFVHQMHQDSYAIIWIGFTDVLDEGNFRWSDASEADFSDWASSNGQLDNSGPNGNGEACATQERNALWWDKPCHHEYLYICKRAKYL